MADHDGIAMPHADVDASTAAHDHDHDHDHDGSSAHGHAGSKAHGALHKAAKGACSPCASCCLGAALPASPLSFDAVSPTDFFLMFTQDGRVSFLTEGLERPPRFFLV